MTPVAAASVNPIVVRRLSFIDLNSLVHRFARPPVDDSAGTLVGLPLLLDQLRSSRA
jgi:hypothetical protein